MCDLEFEVITDRRQNRKQRIFLQSVFVSSVPVDVVEEWIFPVVGIVNRDFQGSFVPLFTLMELNCRVQPVKRFGPEVASPGIFRQSGGNQVLIIPGSLTEKIIPHARVAGNR